MELSTNTTDEKDKSASNEIPLHNCVDIITIIPDANFLPEDGEAEYHNALDQVADSFEYYCCKHCDFRDSNKHTVLTHLNSHASRQTNRCRLCGFTAPYHKTVLKHVELCHRGGAEDVQRGIKFMQNNNMLQLIGVRLKKNLPIPVPSRSTNESKSPFEETVAEQVKMRHNESRLRKIRCEHCSYISKSTVDMSYHKHFHKPNALAPYHCPHCSFWAVEAVSYNKHLKLHNENSSDTQKDDNIELNSNEGSSDNSRELVSNQETDSTEQGGKSIFGKDQDNSCDSSNKSEIISPDGNHDNDVIKTHSVKDLNIDTQRIVSTAKARKAGRVTRQSVIIKKESYTQSSKQDENQTKSEETYFTKGDKVKTFHCYRCPAYFTEESALQDHSCYHGAALTYSCPYCDYRAGYSMYAKHLEMHSSEFISEVTKLNTIDNAQEELDKIKSDTQASKDASVFEVDYWENKETMMLANKSGFFANKIRKHYCSLCPAAFSRKRILLYHSTLHGNKGMYSCSKCGYSTNKSANIISHLSLHHCVEENSYACPKCPLIFYHEEKFIYHLSFHGKKGNFCCDICDYASSTRSKIQNHRALHKQLVNLQDMVATLYDLMETVLINGAVSSTLGNEQNVLPLLPEKGCLKQELLGEENESLRKKSLDDTTADYMKEDTDNEEEEETTQGYHVPMEDTLEVVIKEEPIDEADRESYESPNWEPYESILPD